MRQDKEFEPGQGITSQYFAKLISGYFDQLITIDPHLHRWRTLSAIYGIPAHVMHATNEIGCWIKNHIANPILIGLGTESLDWITSIAERALSPFTILEKIRIDETLVETAVPGVDLLQGATPVVIDDIISSGMTMIETIKHLQSLDLPPPVCISVHAVFADDSYQKLLDSGASKIVTCNTIPHVSNNIDVSMNIIDFLKSIAEFKGNEPIGP